MMQDRVNMVDEMYLAKSLFRHFFHEIFKKGIKMLEKPSDDSIGLEGTHVLMNKV